MVAQEFNILEFKPKDSYSGAVELDEEIELLENNIPSKENKEQYSLWRDIINKLYLQYNSIMKKKIYKQI